MATYILHQGATVLCQHGAQATPVLASQRVKVNGQPAVVQSTSYTIAGCPHTVGSASSPCSSTQWVRAAQRVKVGGEAVLLQDSSAICTPNGTGVTIASTQTRVKAS